MELGKLQLMVSIVIAPAYALQLSPTLCNPINCSPPGSFVHWTSLARILQWFAMPSSKGIFLTQGMNPCLQDWQADSLALRQQWSPSNDLVHVIILPFSLLRCRWCFTRDTWVTNFRSSDREESWAIPRLERAMSWTRSLKARGEKPQSWSWQRNEDRPHQLHKSVIINMGKNVSTQ